MSPPAAWAWVPGRRWGRANNALTDPPENACVGRSGFRPGRGDPPSRGRHDDPQGQAGQVVDDVSALALASERDRDQLDDLDRDRQGVCEHHDHQLGS
jgi:hypothetical protein